MGPVFNREDAGSKLRNGRCAQTVGPGSKIFSSEKPPYWVVLKPLSNQNSADDIYEPLSKFSQSYTLNVDKKALVLNLAQLKNPKDFFIQR